MAPGHAAKKNARNYLLRCRFNGLTLLTTMNTRTILLVAAALAVGHSALLAEAKYSTYTADYYKGAYDLYEGKSITLKVAFVKPYSYKSDIEDIRFFHAVTNDEQKHMDGGEIPVAVPLAGGTDLIKRYGTAPSRDGQVRLLTGILRPDGHGLWFVDVNGSITKNLDAIRQTEIKPRPTPSPSASPSASPEPSATPQAADRNGEEPQRPWWKIW